MDYFNRDFLKFTFQFLAIVFLGVVAISYLSTLDYNEDITAGLIEGE